MAFRIVGSAFPAALAAALWTSPAAAQDPPADTTAEAPADAGVEPPADSQMREGAPLPYLEPAPPPPPPSEPATTTSLHGAPLNMARPRDAHAVGATASFDSAYMAPVYVPVSILGTDPDADFSYYLIPQSVCDRRLTPNTDSCLAFIRGNAARYGYGPSPLGSVRQLDPGLNYYLVPICANLPLWERRRVFSASNAAREVRLSCPR